MMTAAAELNAIRYLYLTEIGEPRDTVLRLVVTEGRVTEEAAGPAELPGLEGMASRVRAIVADRQSASYEITFDSYVAYAVRNESYTVRDDEETFEGSLFRVYSDSKFLAFVAASTIASDDYGGPYAHYGIVCLNHVVDVASAEPPRIVRLT